MAANKEQDLAKKQRKMASTITTNVQLASSNMLGKIDKMREIGVADYIPLPQLVVVGDQSSGKSSVLEGLTELPFPRDSGLCTRFATQITFRRASRKSITVSIIPSTNSTQERSEKLRAFRKDGLISLEGDTFLQILREVCDLMGIPGPGQVEKDRSTFSEDLFKIELCGPDKHHLSVIDIPGIFRAHTPGVTTKEDMGLVRRILHKYIRDERTIILAVVPAPTDIATQEILTLAEQVDPEGHRTLGILTKPDLVDKGAEDGVIELVQGKRNQLRLGYCIVRNRGQQELLSDSAERLRKEREFFNTEPWSKLDPDRVGTSALKLRLQELLQDITRREFPKVKLEVDRQLASCREKLTRLGVDRESSDQQRKYLQDMAIEFQKITDCAIDEFYSRNDVFNSVPDLRLATLVVNRDEQFADDVACYGHSFCFGNTEDNAGAGPVLPNAPSDSNITVKTLAENDFLKYPELADVPSRQRIVSKPELTDTLSWIKDEFKKSRGFDLASIGPAILPALWRKQSQKWEDLALAYIGEAVFYVHRFTCKLMAHVCPEERMCANLRSALMDPLLERYQKAVDHVKFIIHVERSGTLLTQNHYFNENLQKVRLERVGATVQKRATDFDTEGAKEAWVRLSDVVESVPMGNIDHTIQDIHDILASYYHVARKRFVDTVCMQGTNFHLLMGKDNPLRIFAPPFVSSLTDEQLDEIAGEDLCSKRLRKSLKQEIAALEEGRKLLRN